MCFSGPTQASIPAVTISTAVGIAVLLLAIPARADAPRRNFAVVIGNQEYALNPLKTPKHDAEEVARVLRDEYGFVVKPPLIDRDRRTILNTLDQLSQQLSESDSLLIYYAGHGSYTPIRNTSFWIPIEAENDPSARISDDDLFRVVEQSAARHVLIIDDACYSGGLLRGQTARERGLFVSRAPNTTSGRAIWLRKLALARSRRALTSGGTEVVADGGRRGHSIFSFALLQALLENQASMAGSELFTAVAQKMAEAKTRQSPQYGPIPGTTDTFGDFIFNRRRNTYESGRNATTDPGGQRLNGEAANAVSRPAAAAKQAYERGSDAFEHGAFAQAARWFETSNRLSPSDAALEEAIRSHIRDENLARACTLARELLVAHDFAAGPASFANSVLEDYSAQLLRVQAQCDEECGLAVDGKYEEQRTFFVQPDTVHSVEATFESGSKQIEISGESGQTLAVTMSAPPSKPAPIATLPQPSQSEATRSLGGTGTPAGTDTGASSGPNVPAIVLGGLLAVTVVVIVVQAATRHTDHPIVEPVTASSPAGVTLQALSAY